MAITKLKPVDVVVVGVGVAGSIVCKELAQTGLRVVGLERGRMIDPQHDFAVPYAHDELKYDRHSDLLQNLSRETITFRNAMSETALPMREMGSFKPGECVGGAGVHWGGHARRNYSPAAMAPPPLHRQRDQPPGVPPLELTGERTLPDVPAENYWFRRHLAVYEWIAERVAGQRVADLACGEGYGSQVLSSTAARVVGVDANPAAFEHARLRYTTARVSFERDLVDSWTGEVDSVVFLQTIEHVQDPDALLEHLRGLVGPTGALYVSTPNVRTLAPPGADRSDNPWHIREYDAKGFARLCSAHFGRVELLGLHHARRLRAHQFALERLGWDTIHRRLGLTRRFYDAFVPAISARDFAVRPGSLEKALDFLAVLRP